MLTVLVILVLLTVLTVLVTLVLLTVLTVTMLLTVFTVTILLTVLTVSILLTLKHCQQPRLLRATGPPGPGVSVFQRLLLIQSVAISLSRSIFFLYKAPQFFVPTSSQSKTTLPTVCKLVRPPFPQQCCLQWVLLAPVYLARTRIVLC